MSLTTATPEERKARLLDKMRHGPRSHDWMRVSAFEAHHNVNRAERATMERLGQVERRFDVDGHVELRLVPPDERKTPPPLWRRGDWTTAPVDPVAEAGLAARRALRELAHGLGIPASAPESAADVTALLAAIRRRLQGARP